MSAAQLQNERSKLRVSTLTQAHARHRADRSAARGDPLRRHGARATTSPPRASSTTPTGATSHIANIADLKMPLDPEDYDDDPAGEPGSPWFHVAPNLGDEPLQYAWKYIVVYNPDDVAELQVTLRTRPGGTVVYEEAAAGRRRLHRSRVQCPARRGCGRAHRNRPEEQRGDHRDPQPLHAAHGWDLAHRVPDLEAPAAGLVRPVRRHLAPRRGQHAALLRADPHRPDHRLRDRRRRASTSASSSRTSAASTTATSSSATTTGRSWVPATPRRSSPLPTAG